MWIQNIGELMNYNVFEWGGLCLREKIKNLNWLEGLNKPDLPEPVIDGGHGAGESFPFDFGGEGHPTNVREPVIYIENLEDKIIELQVDIMPFGEITETYPKYKNIGDWKVKVRPDGLINDVLPYLFYEVNINLQECLDNKDHFDVYYVPKEEFWEFIMDRMIGDRGFKLEQYHHFVQYWAKYIDKYEDVVNVSIFKDHVIEKYFHTIFSPNAPIEWKRLYFAFWCDK